MLPIRVAPNYFHHGELHWVTDSSRSPDFVQRWWPEVEFRIFKDTVVGWFPEPLNELLHENRPHDYDFIVVQAAVMQFESLQGLREGFNDKPPGGFTALLTKGLRAGLELGQTDVPEKEGKRNEELAKAVAVRVRHGLGHAGFVKRKTLVRRDGPPERMAWWATDPGGTLCIDPDKMVATLNRASQTLLDDLRKPDESALRGRFRDALFFRWDVKQCDVEPAAWNAWESTDTNELERVITRTTR